MRPSGFFHSRFGLSSFHRARLWPFYLRSFPSCFGRYASVPCCRVRDAGVLTIVVLPQATDVTRSEIAGKAISNYLIEELAAIDAAEPNVLTDGRNTTSSTAPEPGGVREISLAELDTYDLAHGGVLVVDGRSWFGKGVLTSFLERAQQSREGARLV